MGNTSSHEWYNWRAINTPLVGVCGTSMLFNSFSNGTLRVANVYTNIVLFLLLGLSTAATSTLHLPVVGAQLGVAAGVLFTVGAPLRILFTNRFFSRPVHYGIGTFYTTSHALQWRKEANYFEDAKEDPDDEVF